MKNPDFDIILVSFGYAEMVKTCVDSIVDNTEEDEARLIWIENVPEKSAMHLVSPSKIPVIALPLHENIDWVKSVNLGLALSTAPYVVIMNADTEVCTEGWLPKMAEGFCNNEVGIVCPRHDKDWGLGKFEPDQGPQPIKPNWHLRSDGIGSPGTGFFCAMLSRDSITNVGYLDENFCPIYGDDDDWAMRAWLMGYRFVCQTDVLVKHRWHGSHRDDTKRDEWQTRAKKILRVKYGDILASRLPQ